MFRFGSARIVAPLTLALFALNWLRGAEAARLQHDGVSIRLPPGWGGLYRSTGRDAPTVLHVANFQLPPSDDDQGSKASRAMTGRSVRIVLLEVGNRAGTNGFVPRRFPIAIRRADFRRSFPGSPKTHAVAGRRFAAASRSFSLWVDFGTRPAPVALLNRVNHVLASLAIRNPWRVSARTWKRLHRPFQPPRPSRGRCRRSATARGVPSVAFPLGRGPVYVGLGAAHGIAPLVDDTRRNGVYFHKTLWAVSPRYRGPLLIRGRSVAGSGVLRFQLGMQRELRWPSDRGTRGRWRYVPTHTVIPREGCYALRIDGIGFSEKLTFLARR